VKCSVEACAERDPKGLYRKASAGQIKDLTGPQDLYEEPLQPDLVVDTEKLTAQESVNSILASFEQLGIAIEELVSSRFAGTKNRGELDGLLRWRTGGYRMRMGAGKAGLIWGSRAPVERR
jgi:hypothetical protein